MFGNYKRMYSFVFLLKICFHADPTFTFKNTEFFG